MLEYLAYKKYKAHKEKQNQQAVQENVEVSVEQDVVINEGSSVSREKGKSPATTNEIDAIDPQDEQFLESNLGATSALDSPMTLKRRIATIANQWSVLKSSKLNSGKVNPIHSDTGTSTPIEKISLENDRNSNIGTSSTAGIVGQSRIGDDDEVSDDDHLAPAPDEETQRTQLEKLLDAFHMNMTPESQQGGSQPRTLTQRMNDSFKVSTFNDKTKELMSDFMQILKDIQNGVPLAGKDLQEFFEKHASDLKSANASVPTFVKTLVLKLLPISAIPSIEELSRPGALMSLIRTVLSVLKTRFPAFVGGSVLSVMAVMVVMLGLFYAFKRGREERELTENSPFSEVDGGAVEGLGMRGRQVEIGLDGVRYVTVLDEDGMRVPVPEDERGVYWDKQK